MVIDFHTHMFPDALAEKTIPMLAKRSRLVPHTDGTVAGTLSKMETAGVDYAVQLSIATNPKQMTKVNDFAIQNNQQQENIIAFGSVHPEAENIEAELDRLRDAGIKGIKLHPDYQSFFVDAPFMQPIYEAILKRDFILTFHTGIDIGLPEPVHATPKAIKNTLGLFAGEKVVFAHMAGYQMPDDALEYIIGNKVYIDTSCAFDFIDEPKLRLMLHSHPADKILFATDCPWGDFKTNIDKILSLNLSDELTDNIMHKNAEKLLQI